MKHRLLNHPVVLVGLLLLAVAAAAGLLFLFSQGVGPGTNRAVDRLIPDIKPSPSPTNQVAVFAPLRGKVLTQQQAEPFVTGVREPHGLGIADGELFVSSWEDQAIYRVNLQTGERTLVTDGVDGAHDMVIGPDGKLVVPLFKDGRVVKIDRKDGRVETLTDALSGPNGITRARSGGYYVTDAKDGRLVKVEENGDVRQIADGLREPAGVVVDNDNIIRLAQYADPINSVIQIQDNGNKTTLVKGLQQAESLAVDYGKNLIIGHTDGGRVAFDIFFTRAEAPQRFLTTTLPGPAVGPVTDGTYLYFESAAPGQDTVYRIPLPK